MIGVANIFKEGPMAINDGFFPELDALRRVLSTPNAERLEWLAAVKKEFDAIACVPPVASIDAMVAAGLTADEIDDIIGDRAAIMAEAAALERAEV